MIETHFPLRDFIQVRAMPPRDTGWPEPSPFNLRFSGRRLTAEQASAISGSGLYMISKGPEVVYVGLYKPASGNIIADRWGRHLQTITARGHNIGFGGRDPAARRAELLGAVSAEGLRRAIDLAYTHSRQDRYRDTGNTATPNRLRFASENWATFGPAQGDEILDSLTFWLLRIRDVGLPGQAADEVRAIEKAVLGSVKPLCNAEYHHAAHATARAANTIPAVTAAIRRAAVAVTAHDITDSVQLAGG